MNTDPAPGSLLIGREEVEAHQQERPRKGAHPPKASELRAERRQKWSFAGENGTDALAGCGEADGGLDPRRLRELRETRIRELYFLAIDELEEESIWRRASWKSIHRRTKLERAVCAGLLIVLGLGVTRMASKPFAWVSDAPLSPFRIITENDVRKYHTLAAGDYMRVSDVLNRYPLQPLPAGTRIRAEYLSPVRLDAVQQEQLKTRDVVAVPIFAHAFPLVTPGAAVDLTFAHSPELHASGRSPSVIQDAFVLDARREQSSAWAIVAVEKSQMDELQHLLHHSAVPALVSLPGDQLYRPMSANPQVPPARGTPR